MLRNLIVFITLVIIAMLPFVTGEHEAEVPSSIRIVKDIPYVDNGKTINPRQTLDVCIPRRSTKKKLPVVIWIHGGGWRSGSKSDTPALELARKGYATVSINYRLTSDAPFPAQLHDAKAAVRWVREKGGEFGLDTTKIAAWGVSAGGHMAALLGVSAGIESLDGELGYTNQSTAVDLVIDWCGPSDLIAFGEQASSARFRQYQPEKLINSLLDGSAEEKPDLAKEASPLHQIEKGKKYPPFLIVHSSGDSVIPVEQSRALADALKLNGSKVELIEVSGDVHVPFDSSNLQSCYDFLARYFRGDS